MAGGLRDITLLASSNALIPDADLVTGEKGQEGQPAWHAMAA
jgi:hypothetical protein